MSNHSEIVLHEFGPQRRFGYLVEWQYVAGDASVTATAFRIESCGDDVLDHSLESEVINGIETPVPLLSMRVKWDGCIDTTIQQNFHVCEAEDLRQLGELFKYIYEKSVSFLKIEDRDLDDWCNDPPTFLPPISLPPKK